MAWALALACSPPGAAAGAEPSEQGPRLKSVLHRLQDHYQKTDTFSANFTEDITGANGSKRQRAGTVRYRKPGEMRWEFAGPEAETIVSDGKELYSYAPDLNQVMKTPLRRAFKSSAPAAFLFGVGRLERDFEAALPPPPQDGLVHVALAPRNGGDKIELGLDPKTYNLAWLKLTDQLGDVTVLRFTEARTNIALDGKLFVFEPPKDADIVEAPGGG